jgi:ribosomal RNA-processing protein 1
MVWFISSPCLYATVNVLFSLAKLTLHSYIDRPTRDGALASLRTYLSGSRNLTPLDLLKLWKGLFYSMWMCDRPKPQANLAAELAQLPSLLPPATVIPFLRAFWQTMAREWTNVDVLRMEKFLLLVRRYIGATFGLCEKDGWSAATVQSHLELLEELPLNVEDIRLPNGMRYHVIDIYVDELERVGVLDENREGVDLEVLLGPLRRLGKESPTKGVRTKCKEALGDERLPGNQKVVTEEAEADGGDWDGIED